MSEKRATDKLKPLLFGRVTRVLFGVCTFILIWVIGVHDLTMVGTCVLGFLGISFLIGGLLANPGCELTAIPNLFLFKKNKIHTK